MNVKLDIGLQMRMYFKFLVIDIFVFLTMNIFHFKVAYHNTSISDVYDHF